MIVIKPNEDTVLLRAAATLQQHESDPSSIAVSGEVDVAAAPRLRELLFNALDSHETDDVLIELSGVTFLDSCGLSVLVQARGAARRKGRRLILISPPSRVRALLEITGLTSSFDIESPEEALN